jgi:hypothetical protein
MGDVFLASRLVEDVISPYTTSRMHLGFRFSPRGDRIAFVSNESGT